MGEPASQETGGSDAVVYISASRHSAYTTQGLSGSYAPVKVLQDAVPKPKADADRDKGPQAACALAQIYQQFRMCMYPLAHLSSYAVRQMVTGGAMQCQWSDEVRQYHWHRVLAGSVIILPGRLV
jgi:hypothetical protein